jgi:CubicO group peptidase (beta-lactamase class C family)
LGDPVSEYLPEFKNLIVIEELPDPVDISTTPPALESVKYRPATNVMTVEHLMTFTSGLFYPSGAVLDWDKDIKNTYTAPQDEANPAGGFIKGIKVQCPFFQFMIPL